jgi:hypothetical protein
MKSLSRPIVLLIGIVLGGGTVAGISSLGSSTDSTDEAKSTAISARQDAKKSSHAERLDEVMALINSRKSRTFALSGSNDASVARLENVNNLREISLNASPITDAALKSIGHLKRVEALSLANTKITSDGLANLSE